MARRPKRWATACGVALLALGHLTLVPAPAAWAATPVAVGPSVNISRLVANQFEPAIAVDPTDPNRVYAASNHEGGAYPAGLMVARSVDGGSMWTRRVVANRRDNALPPGCCDPSLAADSFGNLFFAYLDANGFAVVVALSTDHGASFAVVATLDLWDQPTITVGPGSVWVTYMSEGFMWAAGAAVRGLGSVGSLGPPQRVRGSYGGNFGDIAVGPEGQVVVAYQTPSSGEGPTSIRVNTDPDGLGPAGFGPAVIATRTNVGGFDFIPAQPERSVDAEVGLAFDRSGGPRNGRVYLLYTEERPDESNDTNILARTSDDDGATWGAATTVNDDATRNSQFNPRIALDQTTGNVAATWHDARLDRGSGGAGDPTPGANNDTRVFGALSTDGATFGPNFQVSPGTSNESGGEPTGPGYADLDYGDYSALAFHAGVIHPAWADNSNSTGDDPEGRLHHFDVYTARIRVLTPAGASCPPGLVPTIVGTAGNDLIVGTPGPDVILGGGGDDRISGGGGNDVICGGPGNDYISGGDGNDKLFGDSGNDALSGGDGNDELYAGTGIDRLSGDEGDDRLVTVDGAGGDLAVGGPHLAGDRCISDPGDFVFGCDP